MPLSQPEDQRREAAARWLAGRGHTDLDRSRLVSLLAAIVPPLPGEERDGWSVYRIAFADGAAYVGTTGRPVAERLAEHLGLEHSLDLDAPPLGRRQAILSNGAVLRRAAAGVRYRFRCLASGLDEWQAKTIEDAAIRRLKRPLNRTANARRWRDPLGDDPLGDDPARGAVARFWRKRITSEQSEY